MSIPSSLSAWIVDCQQTALLADKHHTPSQLIISHTLLERLPDASIAQLRPTTLNPQFRHPKSHPDVVIELHSLIQLGIVSRTQEGYRLNQQTHTLLPYRQLVSHLPTPQAMLASHAIQLLRHHQEHRYCSRCGTKAHPHPNEYASVCPACHHRSYPRVQPCVITAILRHSSSHTPQLLLAQHHRHRDGMYGLIAGFVEIGESLESAVVRETIEETGIIVTNVRYFTSQPWPYPTNLMTAFLADYDTGEICIQTEELANAEFFSLDNLPKIPPVGTIARTLIDHVCHIYG
ncbi:MAG: NAD(+) diphosphatase [Moraxella sp.]|nr:NAD(+) diphosphatase [Moraxella sp.]